MPNTFGTATKQIKLVDHRAVIKARARFMRDEIPEIAFANSLYCPSGRTPARGWILVKRADYDLIRGYGNAFRLVVDAMDQSGPSTVTLKNLVIVQARCVTRGIAADPAAIYLVELTDQRGILANRWFNFPTKTYYNTLAPAYPTLYYSGSLNSGTAWTWSTMISDLWTQMVDFLGAFPGLPSSPTGTPTDWNLPGVSAWTALNAMLDHVGMGIAVDLTSATPYTIVSLGATDATFDTYTTKYAGYLQEDLEWIDVGSGRVPGTIKVCFNVKYEYYGTEETVRRDGSQWLTQQPYVVSGSAPATFTGALGTETLFDDFVVRLDVDGSPVAADVTTAAAIAAERITQYFDLIYARTSGYMNRTYAGALPFYAGSQVDGVCWREDFRLRQGWQTQILRGDLWPAVFR